MSHSPQNTSPWAVLESGVKSLKTWQWEQESRTHRGKDSRNPDSSAGGHDPLRVVWAECGDSWEPGQQEKVSEPSKPNTVVKMMFPSAPIPSTSAAFLLRTQHTQPEAQRCRLRPATCYRLLGLPLLLHKHNGLITETQIVFYCQLLGV